MKKQLYLLFVCTLLTCSCTKSNTANNDPIPSLRYRLKSMIFDTNLWHYAYNSMGNCISIATIDNTSSTILTRFDYNSQNLVSEYTDLYGNKSFQYTYTSDNLLATRKQYSDRSFHLLYATYTYYYDTDNNLRSTVTDYADGSKDSLVFRQYLNGRPLQSGEYWSYGTFTTYTKYRYTYDNRMNRTKVEKNYPNDTIAFYTDSESKFFIVNNQKIWSKIAEVNMIQVSSMHDDPNLTTKNKNTDFEVGSNYYTNCGIQKLDESAVLSHNNLGFPVSIKNQATYYNCTHDIDGTNSYEYTLEYETY